MLGLVLLFTSRSSTFAGSNLSDFHVIVKSFFNFQTESRSGRTTLNAEPRGANIARARERADSLRVAISKTLPCTSKGICRVGERRSCEETHSCHNASDCASSLSVAHLVL